MKKIVSVLLVVTIMASVLNVAYATDLEIDFDSGNLTQYDNSSVINISEKDIKFENIEGLYTGKSAEYETDTSCIATDNHLMYSEGSESELPSDSEPSVEYSARSFDFSPTLLTNFNNVIGPVTENGANEPKFSYNNFIEEKISDYSGELTLNFEDLVLDGRNGLDLHIGRTYQTVAANMGEKSIAIFPGENGYLHNYLVYNYSTYLVDRYNLGIGWGFSFPSVQIETEYIPEEIGNTYYYEKEEELYYHTGYGDVYPVEFTSDESDSNLRGYYNKDIQFNRNDESYTNGQCTSYYSLTLSDKTKQYFASDGRLIGIVDRFENTIKFEHELSGVVNQVPQGNFGYDSNLWTSSKYDDTNDAIHLYNEDIGSDDGHVIRFRRDNTSGETYISSHPIQVKPETQYELSIRFMPSDSDPVKIDVIGYDTVYNQRDSEVFRIREVTEDTWNTFKETFLTSTAVRYIVIKITPEYAKDMYIDSVCLDEPKPLISRITDSVGRIIDFTYDGDISGGNMTGSVNVCVKSADGTETKNLIYNKELIEVKAESSKYSESRLYWYLNNSNTEGDDGVSVYYQYYGGTTVNDEGKLEYPKLYSNYDTKTFSESHSSFNKPVLSAVRYKDRQKTYEYEIVRKNLGGQGYYDTLRVRKKYDKYAYLPQGNVNPVYKGELGTVLYSYSGIYDGNTFDNETGYPDYVFDDVSNLNELWTVTKSGKSTETTTFSNCAIIQQTNASAGITYKSDYTNHSVFKNSPTEVENTITQNDLSKTSYILYSYNDWGGIASETKEVSEIVKNNEVLLEKYKTTYQYNPDYHYLTRKSYYNNIDKPQVHEINVFNSTGLLISSENAVKEKTNYHYENSTYPFLVTKTTISDPMRFHNLMGGERIVTYTYDEYGLYPLSISETYDDKTAVKNYDYDYITGNILLKTMPDSSNLQYTYYSDGKVNLIIYPTVQYVDGRLFCIIEQHMYGSNYIIDGYGDEEVILSKEDIIKYVVFIDEAVANPYQFDSNMYDAVGNLKQTKQFYFKENSSDVMYLKSTSKFYHDTFDRLIKSVDNDGNEVHYTYDGFDRPVTVTDSENNVYTYSYDAVQNKVDLSLNGVTEQSDRHLMTQHFDLYGNVVENVVYPDNSTTSLSELYEYDLNNNVIRYTNANGNSTEYLYDAADRLKETILPNGVRATSNYSVFNQPTFEKIYTSDGVEKSSRVTYQNEKGDKNIRFFIYDNKLVDSNGYSYDGKGSIISIREGENQKSIIYDKNDHPIVTTSGDSQIHRRYDKHGEIASVSTNENITEIRYAYDYVGNLGAKLQNQVYYMGYAYSGAGNIIQSQMPSERLENYTYTANGNLDTIVSDNKTFDYDYYDTGYVKSITYPNGLKTTYNYDNINRVTSMTTTKGTTTINTMLYEYDANGNVVSETRNGAETTYTYDSLDRLLSVTYSDGSSITYEYDALNNRTKETYSNGDVKDYVYDAKYQLKEIKLNGQVTDTFTYNATGAVVTHNDETYTYDEWDRMSGYSDGTNTYTYKYDANGIRTQKNDKQYIIDINNNVVAETDSAGAVTDEILWGHQPLARKTNGSWYYYIYNAHGDVVGLVNDVGTVVNTYEYTPWGEIRSETETVDNPIKYAGEYYDDELDMIYLRARYYNPQIGRFTSLDIEEGEISNPLDMNRYVYCRNNPIKYVDPTGESAIATAVAIVGPAVIDAAATAIVYGFTGRHIGAGLVNGFVEGLTTSVSTYIGGIPGAIIGGTLGSALGSMSEDLLFNKNKSVEEIAKSAAESAAWGLVGGLSNSYIGKAIDIANDAGSAAQTLMKYDERFGKAIKIFFEQLVNILSSQ